MTTARVAVVGLGTVGKRVADAIDAQDDMLVAGVAVRRASSAVARSVEAGRLVYATNGTDPLAWADLPVAGSLDDLLGEVDVVVDATPSRTASARISVYRSAGVPAIFLGGEPHAAVGFTYSPVVNHDAAAGRPAVRVPSCNTTSLVRLLHALRSLGLRMANASLVRSATDPDKARKGTVNSIRVVPGISHHAADVRLLVPGVELTTQAVSVPTNHGHVILLTLGLDRIVSAEEVMAALGAAGRVVVADEAPLSTAGLRREWSSAGGRGDRHEVLVWRDSIAVRGDAVQLAAAVHAEAVTVPDVVDCVRAITGLERSAELSMRTTDAALAMREPNCVLDRGSPGMLRRPRPGG